MKMEPVKSFEPVKPASLADFAHKLRHPEMWPEDFIFNFIYEDTCARGLAYVLGMVDQPTTEGMMKAFGISRKDARQLFNAGYAYAYLGRIEITAVTIADRIDAFIHIELDLVFIKDWCEAHPGHPIPLSLFGVVADLP